MKKASQSHHQAHLIRARTLWYLSSACAGLCDPIRWRSEQPEATPGVNSPQQPAWSDARGNPAALSNLAYVARDQSPQSAHSFPSLALRQPAYPFSGGVDRHATASFNDFLYIMGGEFFSGLLTLHHRQGVPIRPGRQHLVGNGRDAQRLRQRRGVRHERQNLSIPGGYDGSTAPHGAATHYIYDIAANSWTTGAAGLPPPATLWAVVACDPAANKVYVVGWFRRRRGRHRHQIYDATANTCSSGAQRLPDGRLRRRRRLMIAGDIYVAGGAGIRGASAATTLYRYNIATNAWSAPLAPMTVGCLYGGAVGVDTSNRLLDRRRRLPFRTAASPAQPAPETL